MRKQLKISQLGKTQLKRLREDIVLNSLNINDYQNRYNIDPEIVCDFFNGYIEYLYEIAQENKDYYINTFGDKVYPYINYDNMINLWEYYSYLEW